MTKRRFGLAWRHAANLIRTRRQHPEAVSAPARQGRRRGDGGEARKRPEIPQKCWLFRAGRAFRKSTAAAKPKQHFAPAPASPSLDRILRSGARRCRADFRRCSAAAPRAESRGELRPVSPRLRQDEAALRDAEHLSRLRARRPLPPAVRIGCFACFRRVRCGSTPPRSASPLNYWGCRRRRRPWRDSPPLCGKSRRTPSRRSRRRRAPAVRRWSFSVRPRPSKPR